MVDNIPLSEWSGSGAVRELHETFKSFSRIAERQTSTMIRLTRYILALSIIMTLAVVVQVVVALRAT